MRIFISYGRGDAADLALRLGEWLRTQGHEPWLDVENGVPIGAPFDVRIEMGISGSGLLMALLSPWSLRPEGFCRNEILYAQALEIPIIPVRVGNVIPPIQIISLNYVDASADPEGAFEKLAPIIEEVVRNGRMSLRDWVFTRTDATWWAAYRPLDFHEELARHGSVFVGREWLFAEIRSWIAKADSRLLLLTADAGVGKSAIAAQMTARLNVRGVHFCARSNIESCRPAAWLAGLVYQLAAQFPAYREQLERFSSPNWESPPDSLFRTLIVEPLRVCQAELAAGEPWVCVVDGLDESVAAAGGALKDLLAHSVGGVPEWLRLVVTSRPDDALMAAFNLPGVRHVHVDARGERNRSDVNAYIARRMEQMTAEEVVPVRPGTATQLARLSEGNFLFAKMSLDALTTTDPDAQLSIDQIGTLPPHLGGLYHAMFSKRFDDKTRYEGEVLPLLDCLVAANGPVPEQLLVKAVAPDEHAVRRGLLALSQFLDRRHGHVQLFHQSLADWLKAPDRSAVFAVSLPEGHRRLAEACWNEYVAGLAQTSAYTLVHLPVHLAETMRWDDLLIVLADPRLDLLTRWVEGRDSDDGLACLAGLVQFLEKNHSRPVMAAGLATQVARIYSIRGQYDDAEKWLTRALSGTSWLRGRRVRAVALHELGSLALYRTERRQATRRYRQALRFCRVGWPVYHDEAAANLVGLATICQTRYRFRKTIRLATRAIREAARADDSRHVIAGRRLIGAACKVLGRYGQAESHIRAAQELSRSHGAHLETARLSLLNGYLLYDLAVLAEETPAKAQQCFQDSLTEAERFHHTYCMVEAGIALGWCSLAMGATAEAMNRLDPLKTVLRAGEHADLRAGLELGLAGIAYQRGDVEAAAAQYRNVLGSCSAHDDRSSCSKALVGLGSIEWHAGRHERARTAWQEALRLATRVSQANRRLAEHSIHLCQGDPRVVPR